MSDPSNQLIGC